MDEKLAKIKSFIDEHHVLTLATSVDDIVSACSAFYVYDTFSNSFIIASDDETLHVTQAVKNKNIAGNILLETDEVGKIQGLQFRGQFCDAKAGDMKKYLLRYPYAVAMKPKLWRLEVNFFKLTDNRLGFGKKIIWP